MDEKPQSSKGPDSLKGLKAKNYTDDGEGWNYTEGEPGKKTVGAEFDSVDAGKFTNVTKGATGSSTTGLVSKGDAHFRGLTNITGPSTMKMEDVAPWLNLGGHQSQAPAPRKIAKPSRGKE